MRRGPHFLQLDMKIRLYGGPKRGTVLGITTDFYEARKPLTVLPDDNTQAMYQPALWQFANGQTTWIYVWPDYEPSPDEVKDYRRRP